MKDHKNFKNLKLIEAANEYIKIGLSIVPLKAGSKIPFVQWKDYQKRLPSQQDLDEWFHDHPERNIGIVCGEVSNNLVVLDFDDEEVGQQWMRKHVYLCRETWIVKTNQGYHVYFRIPEPPSTFSFEGGEVKGAGGYVVAPPSIHQSGKKYEFTNMAEEIAMITSLVDIDIYPKRKQKEHQEGLWWKEGLKGVPEGRRNETGIRLAGRWRRLGMDKDEIMTLLQSWNEKNNPLLPAEELKEIVKSIVKYPTNQKEITQNKKKGGQADRLVKYALDSGVVLFHDQGKDPFAYIIINGHREICRLNSKQFNYWLSKLMSENEKKVPNSEALRSAMRVLASKAVFDGEEKKLFNRVAEYNGSFWYDMTDPKWRSICISHVGWKIFEEPPILFRRYAHQEAQVEPKKINNPIEELKKLFQFIHIEDENNQLMIITYLISCYIPDFPHPILVLHGEKGSGKTIACKILRDLIDPSVSDVMSFTRDGMELIQKISHNWACYFDNITSIPALEQDTLCRACTGQGFSKRKLYTDEEDIVFNFQRCIALNGINLTVTRSDLMDRSLIFELSHLGHKKTEKELLAEFKEIKPSLLGAIFSILSGAIQYYQEGVKSAGLFRMADFAAWGFAITKSLGKDGNEFVEAYNQQIKEKAETTLEIHPLGQAIIAFGDKSLGNVFEKKWKGSPSELLEGLKVVAEQEKIDTSTNPFPQAANWLGRRLKEIQGDLRVNGIEVESKKVGGKRLISIKWQ